MRRVPFVVWLIPGVAVLPLVSGRLFTTPSWLKLGLVLSALALPTVLVVLRYRSDPDPNDLEFSRRRRAAFGVVVLGVVSATWMVGGVDLETLVNLDTVGASDADEVRFDVTVALPRGASLRDLETLGPGVRAFFPRPDNPRIHRLVLAEPPTSNDVDLVVSWRLPVWRTVGEITTSLVAVDEEG